MDSFSEASRAKVTGRPPQDQQAAAPGPPGSVTRAKLSEGPTAEAIALAMATPSGAPFTVRIGDVQSTVRRAGSTVGSVVTVVLRDVTIGEALVIKTIRLTSSATADGGAGAAEASSVVEGVTLGGQAVRFTPEGLEPLGAPAPDLSGLAAAGIGIVSAGEAASTPGGQQSEARATGPRFRFRTPDGRTLMLILGQAVASSTFTPPGS
jgi:hypothetical protein